MPASDGHAFLAPLLAATVSAAILAVLLARPRFLPDRPNTRSLHQRPVARAGGIAVVSGWFAACLALLPGGGILLGSALFVALVSLADDWRGLGVLPRLAAQLGAATLFVRLGLGGPGPVESVVLVLALVWMANLYNFMDGSDGLAAGMGVIGFSTLALGAWAGGHPVLAWASTGVAAACLPFLALNFHPARIFLGDCGSVSLGFLAAALGALGWREGAFSAWFPLLVFSPFVFDATLTLVRRAAAGKRFWEPHREHCYQKLVRMGLGHRGTALAEYVLMAAAAGLALATLEMDPAAQLSAALAWAGLLFALAMIVETRWRRFLRSGMAPDTGAP